ncbi:MAG TPA: M20/M25/M40 family metallo-hydrolase [Trueperaceae bacterium]|nr:M20/M25/M40 family metallo-hydrolase [Trueperaceae bacterium]
MRIAETPAPTFSEGARAELIAGLWSAAGLEPRRDDIGNVIAEVPGGEGPLVLMAAHLDSVFGPGVDVTVKRTPGRYAGPGVGDNAANLAVLTRFLQGPEVARQRPRLIVAATVGEEGVGDLRGARRVVEEFGSSLDHFVALDGHLGVVTDRAVGSVRYKAEFMAGGGHAWGDYPSPSAVHVASEAVARLARLKLPASPRSSLNVGQIWGGTSINSIAESAGFALDLRSVEADTLALLEEAALSEIERAAHDGECRLKLDQLGRRPAATVENSMLVEAARRALERSGLALSCSAGSTDANVAMAVGISSIAFGAYRGGGAHRLEEWVEPESLVLGVVVLARLMEELAAS